MQDPKTKYSKPGSDEHSQNYPGLETQMNTKPIYGSDSYQSSGKLSGKTAIVTGGDSGIGRAVAIAFAKEGADVLIQHLPEERVDADVVINEIEKLGQRGIAVEGDFRDLSICHEIVETAHKTFNHIDILVNNSAIQRNFETIADITAADFEEIHRVNVVAPFETIKYAVPFMRPGSSIINTVSVQAYDPSFILLPYATSKAGFAELTKGLAGQLIEKGIRINAVAPGPIWSPLNTHASPLEKLHKFGESTTIGRPGQPIELAPLYVLLASDEASYITGEIYGITGGSGIV